MAADYEAHPALSSTAASRAGDFALQHKISDIISAGSQKIARVRLQSLEPISCISHLHITFVHCTRVSNSNRMPVSGINDPDTLSFFGANPMRFTLPLIALAAVAAPVAAAPVAEETVTVRIAYGDVDVTTTEGRAAIEARIDAQLRRACTVEGPARYTHGRTSVDSKCVAEARSVAMAEVERVASLQARSGRAVAAN